MARWNVGSSLAVALALATGMGATGCSDGAHPSGAPPASSLQPAAPGGTGGGSGGGSGSGGSTPGTPGTPGGGGSTGGGSGGSVGTTPAPNTASYTLDSTVRRPENIWHLDFDSLGTAFFNNLVGHGLGVASLGPTHPLNAGSKDRVMAAVLARVNTAYLRNANGTKIAGQSLHITFTAVPPNPQQFAGGPGTDFSRICIGSRENSCVVGTVGVEFQDPGNNSVEAFCQLNALGTFAGRICGANSVLNGRTGQADAPLTANDQRFVDGTYRLGAGTAAEDARFRAINDVIVDWGTAIGNVVAHEIGHSVGVDHIGGAPNIMSAVGNQNDFSNPRLPFAQSSIQVLRQNLGTSP